MKKTLILLGLLLVLIAVYVFTKAKDDKNATSISIEDRAFVVKDKSEIDYLTIKNPGYPLMHFQKKANGSWMLNNKYVADPNIINNMIGVLEKMKIKYIPPKTMTKKIMTDLEQVGIEIHAFDKSGETLSHFIMGSNDPKEGSTFCVKKNAKQPYAMYVTVAEGGLRNYFSQTQLELRDKTLLSYNSDKIKELKLSYPKDRKSSFSIEKKAKAYQLTSPEPLYSRDIKANSKTIASYLNEYASVVAEAIRTGEMLNDSIKTNVAFAILDIKLDNGEHHNFEFYPMIDLVDSAINTQSVEDLTKVERYIVFTESNEVYVVQHRMLKNIFRTIDYFGN
jgi:hypothetical protein